MRYMKGSKVEVLNKMELPLGYWRCAEIISGNGHTYSVKYACYSPDMGAAERVPRTAIRPFPPRVEGPMSWVPGDIVEVLENDSWKPAQVLRKVSGDYFFVRILGCSREFRAQASSLRVRQTWKDNRWVVISEEPGKCNNGTIKTQTKIGSHQMPQSCIEVKECKGYDQFYNIIDTGFEEQCGVSSRSMKKRPHFYSPLVETCDATSRKMRAVEKEGQRRRLIARRPSQFLKKVQQLL